MTAGPFTTEDRLDPHYCATCRQHIPQADLDQFGNCGACRAKAEQDRRESALVEQALAKADADIRLSAEYPKLGKGVCPLCNSHRIKEVQRSIWRRILISLFLGRYAILMGREPSWRRRCLSCEYEW